MVNGSGYENTIYQAELCSTGNLKGTISVKHHNKTWFVSKCFAEAVATLFIVK